MPRRSGIQRDSLPTQMGTSYISDQCSGGAGAYEVTSLKPRYNYLCKMRIRCTMHRIHPAVHHPIDRLIDRHCITIHELHSANMYTRDTAKPPDENACCHFNVQKSFIISGGGSGGCGGTTPPSSREEQIYLFPAKLVFSVHRERNRTTGGSQITGR